jgi:protein TonB
MESMKPKIFALLICFVFCGTIFGQTDSMIQEFLSPPKISGEENAEFVGGKMGLRKYISQQYLFPERCEEAGISGVVKVGFYVEIDGTLSNVLVVSGCPECIEFEQEALRIMQHSPKWKPAKQKGKKVRTYIEMPISFHLNTTKNNNVK